MPVYVSDLFTATAAPVSANPTPTRSWTWLRSSTTISGATSSTYTATTADIGSTLSVSQFETNLLGIATATSAVTETVQAFDPIRLFSASEPGVWYDPTDMSTLFQRAGISYVPVTAPNQPVGLMLDKSQGLALGPERITNGNFASGTGWVLADGATISGGALNLAAVSPSRATQVSVSLVAGKTYQLSFEVTSNPSGTTIRVDDDGGGSAQVLSLVTTTTGVFTSVFRALTTSIRIMNLSGAGVATVDNISVKEIAGNHATQSTDASRPLYGIVPVSGRRNLLTYSEQFENAVWAKGAVTVSANSSAAPDGSLTADAVVSTAATGEQRVFFSGIAPTSTVTYTYSVYAKANGANWLVSRDDFTGFADTSFDLVNGVVGTVGASRTAAIVAAGGGWYRCSVTVTTTTAAAGGAINFCLADANNGRATFVGNGTKAIFLWGAQLETGSTATAYQRVSTDLDVTEAGVASVGYLRFDGSTSFMLTPTITPGTDKVQVFAGVRKLTDINVGIVVETGTGSETGTMLITAPRSTGVGNYRFISTGTILADAFPSSGYVAPITNVVTGLGDISGDRATIRVDGTQVAPNTGDQGTGNYGNYPMYIGRRGGSTLALNGQLFPIIVRFGPNLTAARIAATEAWMATKTAGVTLP